MIHLNMDGVKISFTLDIKREQECIIFLITGGIQGV